MNYWTEDVLIPRVDRVTRGASPHQQTIRPEHPERFRVGDIVRVGEERLEGTGKFYYGRELMHALNEAVIVTAKNDDGTLGVQRGYGANPSQRIRRGDPLLIRGLCTWRTQRRLIP